MDIEKHIAYWRDGAREEINTAAMLVENGRFRAGLFWAHLALEKALKAHVTRATKNVPPKTHNLLRLAAITELEMPPEKTLVLKRMNSYQLEGRYPEECLDAPTTQELAESLLKDAGETIQWLMEQL